MLSSRFLAVSFLYLFYATGLAAAAGDSRNPLGGGDQFCQSVRTVTMTVTHTMNGGKPSSSSRSSNNVNTSSLPVVTSRPGNVNLDNGSTSSIVKNTKTSSKVNTRTSTSVIKNTQTSSDKMNTKTSSSSINTITSSVKNGNTNTRNVNTNTKDVNTNTKSVNTNTKSVNTNTKNVNTKTSSINTKTRDVNTKTRDVNTKTSSINTKTSSINTKTSSVNTKTRGGNTKTSTIDVKPTSSPVKGTKTSSILTSSTASPPPVSTSSNAAPPANTDTGNPSTSRTLDPSVIQTINGKGQADGEADSLTSPNDFIGFCVGKTITNGKQVQAGSCNPVPIGDIPSVDKMPSAKFNFPRNFDTVAANTPFTISLQVRNLVSGTFTNAANTYYAAPQQLVGGVIQGHSHVTVQLMKSLDATEPLNPKIFAFFKGLNAASSTGVLTADVAKGLPAGVYRLSSINSAGNHQEALGPVAQRGSFNDVVYFTVTEDGKDANSVSSSALPPASSDISSTSVVKPSDVSSSSVLSSTVSSPDVSSTGKGRKGGKDPKTSSSVKPVVSSTVLPVSTGTRGKDPKASSSVKPVVSSTVLPVSTGTRGKDTISSKPPVSTSGGGKGGKGGDVVSSSTALPKPTTPPVGNGNGGGNGRPSKRMHKRSRLA